MPRLRPRPRMGTTSACAENTQCIFALSMQPRNYLRVRGEYTMYFCAVNATQELPPRARRIRLPNDPYNPCTGTTSACAENTCNYPARSWVVRNYLRVRGEYGTRSPSTPIRTELPPRARRILAKDTASRPNAGTTSACAENTGKTPCPCRRVRNYLRVRGEYSSWTPQGCNACELPPRARRIPYVP